MTSSFRTSGDQISPGVVSATRKRKPNADEKKFDRPWKTVPRDNRGGKPKLDDEVEDVEWRVESSEKYSLFQACSLGDKVEECPLEDEAMDDSRSC